MSASRGPRVARALVGAVAVIVLGGCGIGDNSTTVPPPTTQQSADTVEVLQRSAAEHGICYGWKLIGNGSTLSAGSNLGEGILVSESSRCPRWLEVSATVIYTSSSSEFEDSASVTVSSNGGISSEQDAYPWLSRFGLDKAVFIDDPGWAITRAATLLPLLAVEEGYVTPGPAVAPTAAEPTAAPSNLPSAGNDFLRDRWGYLLAAFVVLASAAALIATGIWQRASQRRTAAQAAARRGPPNQQPGGGPRQNPYRRR